MRGVSDSFSEHVQTLKTTQRVINASKIARYLAPVMDAAGESSAAAAYLARYFEALPIGVYQSTMMQNKRRLALTLVPTTRCR